MALLPEVLAGGEVVDGAAQGPVVAETQTCGQWVAESEIAAIEWYTRQSMLSPVGARGPPTTPCQSAPPTILKEARAVEAAWQAERQVAIPVTPVSSRLGGEQTAMYNWQ